MGCGCWGKGHWIGGQLINVDGGRFRGIEHRLARRRPVRPPSASVRTLSTGRHGTGRFLHLGLRLMCSSLPETKRLRHV